MQKIVFCDTIVRGGHHQFIMKKPEHNAGYYEDIAVYAIPVGDLNPEIFAYRYGAFLVFCAWAILLQATPTLLLVAPRAWSVISSNVRLLRNKSMNGLASS